MWTLAAYSPVASNIATCRVKTLQMPYALIQTEPEREQDLGAVKFQGEK
jgi:hypothetical protein